MAQNDSEKLKVAHDGYYKDGKEHSSVIQAEHFLTTWPSTNSLSNTALCSLFLEGRL
jgi:hypothetical protein